MKILVCGSRDYADRERLEGVMDGILADCREKDGCDPIIVHGQCPYGGADLLADEWAERRDLIRLPYPPAQRTAECFKARDRAMVRDGVDLCVGFSNREHATPGTGYTCRLAYNDGAPVVFVSPTKITRWWNERHSTLPEVAA